MKASVIFGCNIYVVRKHYLALSALCQLVGQKVGLVSEGESTLEVLSLEGFSSLFEKALHSL